MRYALSAITLVLSLVLLGLGIGQRTVWAPPSELSLQVDETVETQALVIDASVLGYYEGAETLHIDDAGEYTVITAREHDLLGWLGDTPYTLASASQDGTVELTQVGEAEASLPENLDSDLWQDVQERSGQGSLSMDVPRGTAVAIVAKEGAAPDAVKVTWPLPESYPWFGPLMTAGLILLALSAGLFLSALAQHRRQRGPQRQTAKTITRAERKAIRTGSTAKGAIRD